MECQRGPQHGRDQSGPYGGRRKRGPYYRMQGRVQIKVLP